ncbi:DUF4365 domain-containing protein [Lentzea cavernae]|uniref:DUF4365 domain-containing protein n=1 Tax=Lentzea cavernae TaxID=2020703 RepID=A0ABQ3MDL2_9PSEU|nr:DUF4365 domain-containing protein [Lentzea cavernae]GHH37965.1 hypothetical protein GCM10017774_27630 [Lentzea cavernae]
MTARQEQFSLAFVRMIAAAAGCSIKSHETDYDGVDITIASSTEYVKYYCPEFELQLKCTTQQSLLRDSDFLWRMERGPFLKLTHGKRYNEAFLGVLVIPRDDEPLLRTGERHLITRSRMYWEHAKLLGEIDDGAASKTVRLPRTNLFGVGSLQSAMQRVGEGGVW